MANIELDYDAHKALVDKFKSAGTGLSGQAVPSTSSTLETPAQYLATIGALLTLIDEYVSLIEKDCQRVIRLMDNLQAADQSP